MSDALLSNEYPRKRSGRSDGATRIVASEMEELERWAGCGPAFRQPRIVSRRRCPLLPSPLAIEQTPGVSQPTLVIDDLLLDRIADRVIERLKARQSSDRKAAA